MYQKKSSYTARSMRFCQWSRKAYAAFASLKCHVTMGCVRKGIIEVSLSKGAMCAQVFINRTRADNDAVTGFGKAETDSETEEILLWADEMPVYAVCAECGGSRDRFYKKNKITRAHRAPVFMGKGTETQSL